MILVNMKEPRVSHQISLPLSIDEKLTSIQAKLGLRSKSGLIERLLHEVLGECEEAAE